VARNVAQPGAWVKQRLPDAAVAQSGLIFGSTAKMHVLSAVRGSRGARLSIEAGPHGPASALRGPPHPCGVALPSSDRLEHARNGARSAIL